MTQLKNKTAIITGASSPRDIGTAICRKLASQGINIFFTYWKAENDWVEEFQQEMVNVGVRCESLEIDLANANAAYVLFDTAETKLGFPSILVNNAAHSKNDGYKLLDAKTLDEHYAVNMRTTLLLCVEFVRRFPKSGFTAGRIINMTSGQDIGPMPGELAYAATKGAISAFTKSLSQEVASLGITVNAVNPGPTDSTWMNDEIREHLLPKFPMGRIGLPEDVASTIAFLASEEAKWITGQIIHSEGGFIRG
ncbi:MULTISPECIES: SDR family oxidoreductase [Bacillaceae]|uniref:SDR family oxidoreductase n=1 Tax=Bacillaceae TaxID=186817 RepID=UPI001E46053A|nr:MULTISPECIES: SDR family oxidoreductase [Bacillaceae]MCE4049364.1 SDR family oxidoreductase [Bacillus sp. Au-Bac7]MCM3032385.1 SDR family oxidoreductase [Niallia sp. MER 6]UPO90218.1 SDR family oxidoreductase [Niallia sp. Man26]